MNKYIVITSINKPNKAIECFNKWKGWQLVVVGDSKSPTNWSHKGVKYLNIDDQYKLFNDLAKAIPENTYTRKMLGYVYAIQNGADYIFESDDDNIPYDFAQKELEDLIEKKSKTSFVLSKNDGWLNIYDKFGEKDCWPRGYPIELLKSTQVAEKIKSSYSSLVIQFLADLDPDVDAVFRMTNGRSVKFKKNLKFTLNNGTYCPFNSQATLWFKEAYPLMYFPLGVPDRVTDILRGYITLTCLWKLKSSIEFRSPIVYQERNEHNLLKDFEQELMLYINSNKWSQNLNQNIKGYSADKLFVSALNLLIKDGFLPESNLKVYKLFSDLINLRKI